MKTDVRNLRHPAASDSDESVNLPRRGFMVSTALAVAGASAAGLFEPTAAAAAAPDPKRSYGHGPFPAEGMALYSSQGQHQRMKFQRRALAALRRSGTEVVFRKVPDLGHGFGPGVGTSAEGWIADATRFWERFMRKEK